MSGTVIPLITERQYDFSNVAGSSSETIVAIKAVDVSQYRHATLLMRLHQTNFGIGATSATLAVEATITAPSRDEPSVDFLAASTVGSVSIDNASEVGDLERDALTEPFGGHLQITVKGTQPSSPTTLQATISAELVVKE